MKTRHDTPRSSSGSPVRNGRSVAGTTSVELAVSAGIGSVVAFLVAKMTMLAFGIWSEGESSIRLQERVEQGMRRLAREVRQADESSLVASAATLRFRRPEDQDGDGTILDSEAVTEFGSEITYSLSGTRLVREQDLDGNGLAEADTPGEVAVVATGLSGLEFVAESPGVRVTMTLEIFPAIGGSSPREEVVVGIIPTLNDSGGS